MVGKTSLINRFVTGSFKREYKATIGVDIFTKQLSIMNQIINLQIWDIAGQTSFRRFRERFFQGSKGALLVFDLTTQKSLDNLHISWIRDINAIAGEIPLVLIGNKVDLKDSIVIKPEFLSKFLENNQEVLANFNTSALTGENVELAFNKLVHYILFYLRKKKSK